MESTSCSRGRTRLRRRRAAQVATCFVLLAGLTGCAGVHQSASLPGFPSPASVSALKGPTGSPRVTSKIIGWHGNYWYAAAAQQPTSSLVMVIFEWERQKWKQAASLSLANSGDDINHGGLDAVAPITTTSLTGNTRAPDFLLHSYGADTSWVNVIADIAEKWRVVPFLDSDGQTLGENEMSVNGRIIVVGYNNCTPSCANGHVTKVSFRYAAGALAAVDSARSCTGEALARAAHGTVEDPYGPGSAGIVAFACSDGYALGLAELGGGDVAIVFRATGQGWDVVPAPLSHGTVVGIPQDVVQNLQAKVAKEAKDSYFPF